MEKLIAESFEEFKAVNEAFNDEDAKVKNIHSAIGPKQERCVIEGDKDVVEKNQAKIKKILDKHDDLNKMQFYEATGKFVGAFKSHAIKHAQRDLKSLDSSIKIFAKPMAH